MPTGREVAMNLNEKIALRLEKHHRELARDQRHLDASMQLLLARKERLATQAGRRLREIVLPRMGELLGHFDNGRVELQQGDDYFGCVCEFAHSPRYPATVRFSIVFVPGNDASYTVRSDLNILPVLMEYPRYQESLFPYDGDDAPLAAWVEDRLLDFVDTYLRLETHPLYQKDNLVVDIVCGMHIPFTAATGSVEHKGRTFYFCSEHCREAFLKANEEPPPISGE
jgi:YHS domain-containing protein